MNDYIPVQKRVGMAQSKAEILIARASALLKRRYNPTGHYAVVAVAVL